MSSEMRPEQQFLIKEYESAVNLTFHIDNLRNRLTSFFLTFAGIAAAGLTILLKGEATQSRFDIPEGVIAILLIIVAVIGSIAIGILGRLRRVQIEHFRIINNIRKYFLKQDSELWNVVELSEATLPIPNRKSGTYLWMTMIMLVSSYLAAFGFYIFIFKIFHLFNPLTANLLGCLFFLFVLFLLDRLYFIVASPPPPPKLYSEQ